MEGTPFPCECCMTTCTVNCLMNIHHAYPVDVSSCRQFVPTSFCICSSAQMQASALHVMTSRCHGAGRDALSSILPARLLVMLCAAFSESLCLTHICMGCREIMEGGQMIRAGGLSHLVCTRAVVIVLSVAMVLLLHLLMPSGWPFQMLQMLQECGALTALAGYTRLPSSTHRPSRFQTPSRCIISTVRPCLQAAFRIPGHVSIYQCMPFLNTGVIVSL